MFHLKYFEVHTINFSNFPETLEFLERGELVKDYNANMTSLDSEDDEDPKTPASITSQEGHGLDFVDVEAFSVIPDNSLPELNLHVSSF